MKDNVKIISLIVLAAVFCLLYVVPGLTADNYAFFLSQRLPKVAAIIITGGAIGFSAVLFQSVTNNRILTPAVLGLDALYLFIQAAIFISFGAFSFLVVDRNANFLVSASIMIVLSMMLFRLLLGRGGRDLIFIILVGTIFGQLFRTLAFFLLMIMSPSEFTSMQNKMFASFSNINSEIVLVAAIVTVAGIVYLLRDLSRYDVISLGKTQAVSLGVDHDAIVKRTFIISAMLVSAATALVGPIAFLGLMTANLAREMSSTFRHATVLVLAILLSVCMLMGAHLVVERYLNFDTTVTVLINFTGGAYFIWLLLKQNKL